MNTLISLIKEFTRKNNLEFEKLSMNEYIIRVPKSQRTVTIMTKERSEEMAKFILGQRDMIIENYGKLLKSNMEVDRLNEKIDKAKKNFDKYIKSLCI